MAAARTLDLGRRVQGASLGGSFVRGVALAWSLLRSVRIALFTILLLATATLAGTLIEQVPPSVLADSDSYAGWLERVRPRYGPWTGMLERLQLFHVFGSAGFRILLGWLAASTIACTLGRWPAIRAAIFHPTVRVGEGFFDRPHLRSSIQSDVPLAAAASAVRSSLRAARYRVLEDGSGTEALYGDRFRFCRLGTLASHLSILLLLSGAIIGGLWGWRNDDFVLAEGSRVRLPRAGQVSVGLVQFSAEYYADGRPRDYASDIVIYDGGTAVKQATVRPNAPASYKGMTFSQASFGQAAVVEVRDAAGRVLFSDGVPLNWSSVSGRPAGFFDLPQTHLRAYITGPAAGGYDPTIPEGAILLDVFDGEGGQRLGRGNLERNQSLSADGYTVTFLRETRFSGLTVAKDPGLTIIWVACGLMVFGLVMTFWFPHRQVWALCTPSAGGGAAVHLAAAAAHDPGIEEEFKELVGRVDRALAASLAKQSGGDTGG